MSEFRFQKFLQIGVQPFSTNLQRFGLLILSVKCLQQFLHHRFGNFVFSFQTLVQRYHNYKSKQHKIFLSAVNQFKVLNAISEHSFSQVAECPNILVNLNFSKADDLMKDKLFITEFRSYFNITLHKYTFLNQSLHINNKMLNNYFNEYQSQHRVVEPTHQLGAVYLGDVNAALDLKFLNENHINTVITAAEAMEHVKYQAKENMTHIKYPLYDIQNQKISRFFEDNFKNIEQGRSRGNVLIHCAAGISRSATLLIAYLMKKQKWSFKKAIGFVRQRRQTVCPNLGFERQLKNYEKQIFLKNRAQSIRIDAKTSDQPKHHKVNNQRTSLPEIVNGLSKTQTKKMMNIKQQPQNARLKKQYGYFDKDLDLQKNLIIHSFKPSDQKGEMRLISYSSHDRAHPLIFRKKQKQLLQRQESAINAKDLKRLTMIKLGIYKKLEGKVPSQRLYRLKK